MDDKIEGVNLINVLKKFSNRSGLTHHPVLCHLGKKHLLKEWSTVLPWKLGLWDTWAFLAESSSLVWFQASPTQDPSLWNGKTPMELPWSLGWSTRRAALWSMKLGCILCIPKCTSGVSPATTSPWATRSTPGTLGTPRTWCWWRGRWWTTALLARCGPAAATWGLYSISPVLIICMSMCLNSLWSVLRNLRHFLAYINSKQSTLGFSPVWFPVSGPENIVLNESFLKSTWGHERRHEPRGSWDCGVQQVHSSLKAHSQTGGGLWVTNMKLWAAMWRRKGREKWLPVAYASSYTRLKRPSVFGHIENGTF